MKDKDNVLEIWVVRLLKIQGKLLISAEAFLWSRYEHLNFNVYSKE